MYHGTYKSWHYSALDQINSSNVKQLQACLDAQSGQQPAWRHPVLPAGDRWQVYYTTAKDQIWAVNGATGAFLWTFKPKIDKELAEATPYNRYNRGLAAGLRQSLYRHCRWPTDRRRHEDRQAVWDTKLIDVAKGAKGFTGAPLVVKDKVIVGSNGGELAGCCGPIFAVDAQHRQEGLAVRHDRRRRTLARQAGATTAGRPAAAAAG